MIANTPKPPYYMVVFTSVKKANDEGYKIMLDEMTRLVNKQEGFLGFESAEESVGITVSYWKDLESISRWKANQAHGLAQDQGKSKWYRSFKVRIGKVEKDYGFDF